MMNFDTVEPLVCEYFQVILKDNAIILSDTALVAAIDALCDLICENESAARALEAASIQYLQ